MVLLGPTFTFDDRKRFDAQIEHDRVRNELLTDIEPARTADPWKQRPVDFSMKNFHPNRKKNKHEENFIASSSDFSAREKAPLEFTRPLDPTVMEPFVSSSSSSTLEQLSHRTNDSSEFDLDTRIKYSRVKRMLNTEQYQNPQPHDYRGYPDIKQLGLSEFHTAHSADPFNLKFHSGRLNTIWLQERAEELRETSTENLPPMYRPLTSQPKWESRLILPKLVYPNKYVAFTRFRNPTRTVQSAYWERVEDHFNQHSNREKLH